MFRHLGQHLGHDVGLGEALGADAQRPVVLRGVGCAKINLQVRAQNTKVIGFYERLGFASENLVSMGKRLTQD